MLERDVDNLTTFFSTFAPELTDRKYGKEIWAHYQKGDLTPDTPLSGKVAPPTKPVNVNAFLHEINPAREEAEEEARRLAAVMQG